VPSRRLIRRSNGCRVPNTCWMPAVAKAKDRLFLASLKRFIERMNLDDSTNR
jgi:hypothetical protein